MHDREKSDRLVVPAKLPNNPAQAGAEVVEGRGLPEGNTASETRPGPSAGLDVSSDLDRVRQVARKDKDVRFTALLHHVSVDRLREAYRAISPNAAPGVDGVTWRDYGRDLEANLQDLHARVHRGAYRARPTRRVFIPKPDGRLRPLGVAALEDKILQRAVVEVLNAIYEQDFLGFSYWCVSVLAGDWIEGDAAAADLLKDLLGGCCPSERFGVLVMGCEIGLDRVDEVGDAVEDPATDRFVGELAEEDLD